MKTTVSSMGQIVLPAELRKRDGIEAGEEFEVERLDAGDYRLIRRQPKPKAGVVAWLLACPVKGYFTAVSSESTDSL
jgi:AbrB family looped-hinge helix DNA binding protein